MLKIKHILGTALMVSALLFPTAQANAEPIPIKVAHGCPPDFVISRAFRDVFKPMVEEGTKGKYRVDVYDSYKFGTWDVEFQAVQYGTLHIMQDAVANLAGVVPSISVLDLPYIAPDPAKYDQLLDSKPVIDLLKQFERFDVSCVGRVHSGARNIFSRKKVETLDDFKAFKMRSTSSKIHNGLLKAENMNPTPVPFAETYTALQQGVVDGVDVDVTQGVLLNFQTVAPYLYMNSHTMLGQLILANKTWWETELKGEDKAVFDAAMAATVEYIRVNGPKDELAAIEKMKADGGTVIYPDEKELERWRAATKDVYKQFSKQVSEELVQAISAAAQ